MQHEKKARATATRTAFQFGQGYTVDPENRLMLSTIRLDHARQSLVKVHLPIVTARAGLGTKMVRQAEAQRLLAAEMPPVGRLQWKPKQSKHLNHWVNLEES